MHSGKKVFWEGIESTRTTATEVTRVPRNCVMPVIRDAQTGVYNVSPYTGGVISLEPLIMAIGVMGKGNQERIRQVEEFTAGLPSSDQVREVWAAANRMPDGISELDVMGWSLFQTDGMRAPGIRECRMNLQCKILQLFKLPAPWRTIMIVRVTGMCIDEEVVELDREAMLQLFPTLEGGMSIPGGYYGLSTFTGGIQAPTAKPVRYSGKGAVDGKIFIEEGEFRREEYKPILAAGIVPSPTYIVTVNDAAGNTMGEVIDVGHLQASQPCLHVPFKKDSRVWARIREVGAFTINMPNIGCREQVNRLRESPGTDPAGAGFTPAGRSMFGIPVYTECEMGIDARLIARTDVDECDTVFTVSAKVGAILDEEVEALADLTRTPPATAYEAVNGVYSRYIYRMFDIDMRPVEVRYGQYSVQGFATTPSWGNRISVAWHDFDSFIDYLQELVWLKILSKWEFQKIVNELMLWNDSKGILYLRKYYPAGAMEAMRTRLTTLIKLMVWAHRDPWEWDRVHAFLESFPNPYKYKDHHTGPMHMPNWDIGQYI